MWVAVDIFLIVAMGAAMVGAHHLVERFGNRPLGRGNAEQHAVMSIAVTGVAIIGLAMRHLISQVGWSVAVVAGVAAMLAGIGASCLVLRFLLRAEERASEKST